MFVTDFEGFRRRDFASMVGGFAILSTFYDMTVGFTSAATQIGA
jgi:hypothetical protein